MYQELRDNRCSLRSRCRCFLPPFCVLCTAEWMVLPLFIAPEAFCGACRAFPESRRAVRRTGGGQDRPAVCGSGPSSASSAQRLCCFLAVWPRARQTELGSLCAYRRVLWSRKCGTWSTSRRPANAPLVFLFRWEAGAVAVLRGNREAHVISAANSPGDL